mgnify:CR=1 FL=1
MVTNSWSSILCILDQLLKPKQAHLSSHRACSFTTLLAGIVCAIRVDVPRFLVFLVIAGCLAAALKGLLGSSANVPAQSAADAVEPLGICTSDGGEGILGRSDGNVVTLAQLNASFAVEGAVGCSARRCGNGNAESHGIGEDHGAEGECMGTDGGEEDGGDIGMHERSASGEGVGGGSCRSGKDASIGLDNGEKLIIAIEFQVGNVWRRATVDNELVENFERLAAFTESVDDGSAAPDSAGEAHAEVDLHASIAHDAVKMLLVLLEFESGHESETAETEG